MTTAQREIPAEAQQHENGLATWETRQAWGGPAVLIVGTVGVAGYTANWWEIHPNGQVCPRGLLKPAPTPADIRRIKPAVVAAGHKIANTYTENDFMKN